LAFQFYKLHLFNIIIWKSFFRNVYYLLVVMGRDSILSFYRLRDIIQRRKTDWRPWMVTYKSFTNSSNKISYILFFYACNFISKM